MACKAPSGVRDHSKRAATTYSVETNRVTEQCHLEIVLPGTIISMPHTLDDLEGAVNELQAAFDIMKGQCKNDCTSEFPSTVVSDGVRNALSSKRESPALVLPLVLGKSTYAARPCARPDTAVPAGRVDL